MADIIKIILIFTISLTATFILLPTLSQVASEMGLLDHPNRRKMHFQPKPLIGGLGITMTVSICGLLLIQLSYLQGIFAGMIILTVVGFFDDFHEVNHWRKFAAQIAAVMIMVYFSNVRLVSFGDLLSIGPIELSAAAIPLTIFCTVGAINAVNMIDGLDGLLGGFALIAFLSFAVLAFLNDQRELMLFSTCFSGALIAFLRYNWRLSQLFMGDAGSLSIGFALAFLALAISQKPGSHVSPVVPLLILAIPIVDTLTVMTKRIINGRSPFSADKTHLHHMLLRCGFHKKNVVKVILTISAGLSIAGVAGTLLGLRDYSLFSFFLVYAGLTLLSSVFIKDILEAKIILQRGISVYRKPGRLMITLANALNAVTKVSRKAKRYYAQLPVICSFEGGSLEGTICEIGCGGFSAKFVEPLPAGQTVEANIRLMDDDKTVRMTAVAELVWTLKSSMWCSHGFKFAGLTREQIGMLESLLRKSIVSSSRCTASGNSNGALRHGPQVIEIGGVRCALDFENNCFPDELGVILDNYQQWGFCTKGIPELRIAVGTRPIPSPQHLNRGIFYKATEYDTVSVSMFFDTTTLKGRIGIVEKETDTFTPVRVLEMIETFISNAYLFYFMLHGRGTFIHSCGIADQSTDYIFVGPSGNGKSTIARLSWPRTVLCDDLVVLRKDENGTGSVFGTPFFGDLASVNKGAECAGLYFIEKSNFNEVIPISRMTAVVELMKEGVIGNLMSLPEISRIIPHSRLLTHLIDLLEGIPCYRLKFRKDDSFWEVIREQNRQTVEKA